MNPFKFFRRKKINKDCDKDKAIREYTKELKDKARKLNEAIEKDKRKKD